MKVDRFIQERQPTWDELSDLVDRINRRGTRSLSIDQMQRMLELYRRTSADLARLRTMEADPAVLARVNRLVSRAHAQVYRAPSRASFSITHFFLVLYPQLFRQTSRFTAASFILSAAVYVMAYQTVQENPDVVADILGGMMDREFMGEKTAEDITERFKTMPSSILSAAVTTNNIRVALTAFALGVTFGIGTVYILIVNGAMLGGIAGAFGRSGVESVLWTTILPHGALELSAIVIAGGAGLLMGWSLWCPGRRARVAALREESVKAMLLAVGLIPAFIVAGFFEGFVTPSSVLPESVKVALGVGVAILFWLYLFFGGRSSDTNASSAPQHEPITTSGAF